MTFADLQADFKKLADAKKAADCAWFFKTEKGEYGEGDVFLGVKVPDQRKLSRKYKDLPLDSVRRLLESEFHEHRLTGLFILVLQYEKAKDDLREKIVDLYLEMVTKGHVNNWDLVDSSAPNILGDWLMRHDRAVLYKLAMSANLWERRVAMLSTFTLIRGGEFEDALALAEILLHDKHDLMHKAVGWMLREIGNRNTEVLRKFLNKWSNEMPRTMLRYAIEKLPEAERKSWLAKGKKSA